MIRIEHLKKVYPNATPLADVNAEINDGDVIAVIGPSGTGKSTLLRCINRLETPTSGRILVDGTDVTDPKCDLGRLRRKMGMVFQSFNLFGHMTVIENIMLAPTLLLRRSRQEAYDEGVSLLRRVGLAEKAMNYPDELSGGQKQRVAIARALITNPKIILADEPTGALDSKTSEEVMQLLGKLNREEGVTIIVVTHESGVANCTDKIVHIKDGIIGEIEDNREHRASVFGTSTIMK